MTNEGHVNKYLGVEIEEDQKSKLITFRQTFLTQRAIKIAMLKEANTMNVTVVKPILTKNLKGKNTTAAWDFG